MTDDGRRGPAGMLELHNRIGGALDELVTPPAPVQTVIRKGRAVRLRRRAAVAAGIAVAAAGIVAAPILVHAKWANSPTPSVHLPKVKVDRVGPHAPRGLIARGTIDGRPWSIRVRRMGYSLCVIPSSEPSMGCQRFLPGSAGDGPVGIQGGGGSGTYYLVGVVRPGVSMVVVRLSDGAKLRLVPVSYGAVRWIGVTLPARPSIASLAAYSAHHEIGYAIPFEMNQQVPTFAKWLRPGQSQPASVTTRIGSGVSAGRHWWASVHAGPWGLCEVMIVSGQGVNASCASHLGSGYGADLGSGGRQTTSGSLPWYLFGNVPASAHDVKFTTSEGKMTVPAVAAGRLRFYILVIGKAGVRVRNWSAYDSACHAMESGPAVVGTAVGCGASTGP